MGVHTATEPWGTAYNNSRLGCHLNARTKVVTIINATYGKEKSNRGSPHYTDEQGGSVAGTERMVYADVLNNH